MQAGLKRRFRNLVSLLLVGLLGWWGYTTFLMPPKAVIIRTRVTNDATQHLMERNWEAALTTVQAGLDSLPGDWELLVWQSALLEKLGRSGAESLALAEKQAPKWDVWISLGTVTILLESPEKMHMVGEQVIALAPNLPHGFFFLAKAYEVTGQIEEALRAYHDAEKRAADNPEYYGLFVAVRERIFALSTFQP